MQVNQNTTALVIGSLASLASTVAPTVATVPAPTKAKASKPAQTISPRRAVTLALDAMCEAYDQWRINELRECGDTVDAWSFGDIELDESEFNALEIWRSEVANRSQFAFLTFTRENPKWGAAYTKASDEWKAYKQAKKAGGVR